MDKRGLTTFREPHRHFPLGAVEEEHPTDGDIVFALSIGDVTVEDADLLELGVVAANAGRHATRSQLVRGWVAMHREYTAEGGSGGDDSP